MESIVETKPNVVKVDTHLVNGLSDHPLKRSLVKFLVSFCRDNGIISIAEGIERKEDLDALISLGVDAGQGYLLCRPTPQPNLSEIFKDLHVRLGVQTPPVVNSS